VHGPDRASIREPAATLLYRHRYSVNPQQHLIDRCRQLAAKAFAYEVDGPPRFDLLPEPFKDAPTTPYVVFLHATSRDDKLWPESHWQRLIGHFTQNGMTVILPWGSGIEAQRSQRLAAAGTDAVVPPRLDLTQIAGLLASADLVCGVDTGLVHLAAAIGTPTVSLFVATDPYLAGVARAGLHARDLGGVGMLPTPDDVIAVAGHLLVAERCC
jgi:heptosyltransferase-1